MTKNPFYNALVALGYIVGIVLILFIGPRVLGGPEESILYPMAALSLLVLSVSVMAYLFFYQPIVMLLDGKREEALSFFLRTVGTFAVGTIALGLISVVLNG